MHNLKFYVWIHETSCLVSKIRIFMSAIHDTQYLCPVSMIHNFLDLVSMIIIIIIKKGRQCKAMIEWYTPYQSEDPSPTIPTYRQKKEKRKESRRL